MAQDPVCGMEVEEATASEKTEYKGKTYYFCACGCKDAFEKDPEKYVETKKGSCRWQHVWSGSPDL